MMARPGTPAAAAFNSAEGCVTFFHEESEPAWGSDSFDATSAALP